MREKQLVLDPALSIKSVADKVELPIKQVSSLINSYLGKHFFDFVNEYRVVKATELLRNNDLTTQQVMYDVGFNSKSSFHTAFKKQTNQTPTAYRNYIVSN